MLTAFSTLKMPWNITSPPFETHKLLAFGCYQIGDLAKSRSNAEAGFAIKKNDAELKAFYDHLTSKAKNKSSGGKGSAKEPASDVSHQARQYFKAGEYEKAISAYREVLDQDKRAFFYIGMSYFRLKDYDNAATYLEKALEQQENDFNTRKALAIVTK